MPTHRIHRRPNRTRYLMDDGTPPPRVGNLVLTPRQIDALAVYRELLAASGAARVVSLPELADRLGVVRAAAWKHARALADVGLIDWSCLTHGRAESPEDEEPDEGERARIEAVIAELRAARMGRCGPA